MPICRTLPDLLPLHATNSHAECGDRSHGGVLRTRHVWGIIILALILAAVSGAYTIRHFSIDTNVNNLISRDLPWRKQELNTRRHFRKAGS